MISDRTLGIFPISVADRTAFENHIAEKRECDKEREFECKKNNDWGRSRCIDKRWVR